MNRARAIFGATGAGAGRSSSHQASMPSLVEATGLDAIAAGLVGCPLPPAAPNLPVQLLTRLFGNTPLRESQAVLRSLLVWWKIDIVAFSFVFGRNYLIMDYLGLKDSSRQLQANCAISYSFYLHLMLHACAARFDVTGNLENFWFLGGI